jgi:hypothetical protein
MSYQTSVSRFAAERSAERFSNRGYDHAEIVLLAGLANAEFTVDVYTGKCQDNFYNKQSILSAFDNFLSGGANRNVRIVLENSGDGTAQKNARSFRASLIERHRSQVSLFQANTKLPLEPYGHFWIFDGRGFRFETNLDKAEAVVCFNEPDTAAVLLRAFETVASQATLLTPNVDG